MSFGEIDPLMVGINQSVVEDSLRRLAVAANGGVEPEGANASLPQILEDLQIILPGIVTNRNAKVGYRIWALIQCIKMASYLYKKSHCGDKTVIRLSYLYNGISYTGKMTSLY